MPRLPPVQAPNGDNYEPMELDVAELDDKDETPVLDEVNTDLESYICQYHGLPRIYRLEFVADHCKSLRIEALNMAITYIKDHTLNVKDYLRLIKKLQEAKEERDGPGSAATVTPDTEWVDRKTKQAGLKFERLDNELKSFKANSMKDNIRRAQDDLGDYYLDCGDLENAYHAYLRSRDYSTTQRNQVNQCLYMIGVCILLKRWSVVSNHILRAEAQPSHDGPPTTSATTTKLHCAAGLFELHSRRYKKAAKQFLSANFDHFNMTSTPQATASTSTAHKDIPSSAGQWEILAPVNIAVYGSLCALATYSRQELSVHLINSTSFKQFAELDPQLREAVANFFESKFAACLSILQEMKGSLLLDMYLAPHVGRLYRAIRNKALIQYFEPYSTTSICKMAQAFNSSVPKLEEEIIPLIQDGHLKARIDSVNKILYARKTDARVNTFERAIKFGKSWQRQAQALIFRTALLNSNLIVIAPNKD